MNSSAHLPLLSVIMRTMGRDMQLLKKAICSVFESSYSHIEVILVFQGIDDALFEKLKNEIDSLWPNKLLVLVQNKTTNDERSKNLNLGLEAAKGHYLAFLDDDDYVGYKHYDNLIAAIIKNGSSMAFCIAQVVDERGRDKFGLFEGRFIDKLSFYKDNFITIHSFVVTKNAVEQWNLKFDERLQLAEDYLFLLPLYMKTPVSFVKERSCFYRIVYEKSKSFTTYDEGNRDQQYKLLKKLKRQYKPTFFQKWNIKMKRLLGLVYKVGKD